MKNFLKEDKRMTKHYNEHFLLHKTIKSEVDFNCVRYDTHYTILKKGKDGCTSKNYYKSRGAFSCKSPKL